MEKYYTPSIEEFHVGFEYEWSEHSRKIWIEETADQDDVLLAYTSYEETPNIYPNEYRVKYLDREDIEDLGFIYKEMPNRGINFTKGIYSLYYRDFDNKLIINQENIVEYFHCMFTGYIKNKSEFKKLLKQLKIID